MSTVISRAGLIPDLWQPSEDGSFIDAQARRGIAVAGETPAAEVAAAVQARGAALVAIRIPSFADGRGFTLAHDLRRHHGYGGTLRATGGCLPDQAQDLFRCGFDEIALPEGADLEVWLRTARGFSDAYAGNLIEPQPLFRRRTG